MTFEDWDGTVLDTQAVEDGAAATAPADPDNKAGWHFIGWDVAFDEITGNLTVTALYEIDPETPETPETCFNIFMRFLLSLFNFITELIRMVGFYFG